MPERVDLVRLLLWCLWRQLRDEESVPSPFFLLAPHEIATIREQEHARIRVVDASETYEDWLLRQRAS